VYVRRFFARPLGTFFFSCFSTCVRMLRQLFVLSECDGYAMAVVASALGGEVAYVVSEVGGERFLAQAEGEWYRTLGVCDLTLPARASEPWTLPMLAVDLGF
jgi:hypothetical protein